jgi:hypothetical protein
MFCLVGCTNNLFFANHMEKFLGSFIARFDQSLISSYQLTQIHLTTQSQLPNCIHSARSGLSISSAADLSVYLYQGLPAKFLHSHPRLRILSKRVSQLPNFAISL